MEFRNDRERYAVCALLMRMCRRPDLWTDAGPSQRARLLRDQGGNPLSPGERVMLLAAFALFDGDESLRFVELDRLDPPNLYAIGSLLASNAIDAMAPDKKPTCLDLWLSDQESLLS